MHVSKTLLTKFRADEASGKSN